MPELETKNAKIMSTFLGFEDHGILFNRKEDPDEMINLWDEDSLKDVKLELILKLMRKILGNTESYVKRDCQY